jgi:ABC-type polysaccharide/polyol phosphate export permease
VFASGALFPSSSFPGWLKGIADVNPISKASEAARLLLLNGTLTGSNFWTFANDMIYLVVFATVLALLGYLAARNALKAE